MRPVLILFAVLGLSAAALKLRNLNGELPNFLSLIPWEKLDAIIRDHAANDGTTIALIQFLQGNEWHYLIDTVLSKPAVVEFIQDLTDDGLPAQDIIDTIHNYIKDLKTGNEPDQNGTLLSLLNDVINVISVNELLTLWHVELQTNPEILNLFEKISSEETHQLVLEVLKMEAAQRLIGRLNELAVPVDTILNTVFGFLEWGPYPPTLKKYAAF